MGGAGPPFRRWEVVLAPGEERAYRAEEWADALVVVACGRVALCGRGGATLRVGAGAVLWLAALPLRALRNEAVEPAVLLAVSRSTPSVDCAP